MKLADGKMVVQVEADAEGLTVELLWPEVGGQIRFGRRDATALRDALDSALRST